MTMARFKRHATRSPALLLVLLGALLPLLAQEPEPSPHPVGYTRLQGKVQGSGDQRRVAGAVVLAYHLSTDEMYRSEPTGSNGAYAIEGLPFGYYDLAVEGPEGLFVGSHVVNIPPGGKATINFTMIAFDTTTALAEARQEFGGLDRPSSGTATVTRKRTSREFWRGPKGVAIMAGTGGVILLVIASDSNETSASNFFP